MGARDYIKAFQIQAGNAELFAYIVGGLLAVVLLVILIRILKVYILKYKSEKLDRERFYLICKKRRLSPEQIDFLEEIIQRYQLRRRIVLVRNIQVFDKYMAREVARFRDMETKQKEHFKTFVFELRKKLGFAHFEHLEELTSTRQIKEAIRAKVTIEIANLEKNFEGTITKVDEEEVVVTVPDQFIREEPIRINQNVTLTMTHTDDAEYNFKSVVYKIIPGPPGYIAIEHSHVYTRSQKRKYPRLNVKIPFRYFVLNHFQEKEFRERRIVTIHPETLFQEETIHNISGGGCYFNSRTEYNVGNLIWLAFYLDEVGMELKDIVGHVERVTDLDTAEYRIILHFSRIADANRDKIVRYIYNKKIEQKELAKELKKVKIV